MTSGEWIISALLSLNVVVSVVIYYLLKCHCESVQKREEAARLVGERRIEALINELLVSVHVRPFTAE